MSGLDSLIRLHRWQLDERRRALTELEAERDRMTGERTALDADLARERDVVAAGETPPPGFGAWLSAALTRQQRLDRAIVRLDGRIDAAIDEITAAFRELKTYEIAQAERDRRATAAAARTERATLDEIGVTRHHRRRLADADS